MHSDTIARVRITSRKPAFIGKAPEEGVCGYEFTANIIETLKGNTGTVSFFSRSDSDFTGFDHDYLVFIHHRAPEQAREAIRVIDEVLSLSELADLRCRNSNVYFLPTRGRSMLAFSNAATKQFGGDWLPAGAGDHSMNWCVQGHVDDPNEDVGVRELTKGDDSSRVIGWDRVKTLVRRALIAPDMFVRC
jgi:hypothetical protein